MKQEEEDCLDSVITTLDTSQSMHVLQDQNTTEPRKVFRMISRYHQIKHQQAGHTTS
jgi:hypothetical protein